MKTRTDPRHRKRAQTVQDLFAYSFNQSQKVNDQAIEIIKHLPEIDQLVVTSAPERPLNQINKLDLAILRLAVYELTVTRNVPFKVVVDEAVELSKEFGADSSPQFVNGALGQLIKVQHLSSWQGYIN